MTRWDEDRAARAVLSQVCGAGDVRLTQLLRTNTAVDAVAALRSSRTESAWAARARVADEGALEEAATRLGMQFLVPSDRVWPTLLDDLDRCEPVAGMGGAPIGLWARGDLAPLERLSHSVAVVGARAATRYGEAVAVELAAQLSGGAARLTVLSGGAYGIDAAAHRGALAAGGQTIGIYAGGLDEPYPRGNARLFEQLVAEHLVLSEVAPGSGVTRAGFLARNRLIAALSMGTIVVEAAERSGARNTAAWAYELGRHVMAVPGSVHSAMSTGCHRMIRDGRATLVSDADDVLALLAPLGQGPLLPSGGATRRLDELDAQLLELREAMPSRRSVSAAELAAGLGLPVGQAVARLIELEALGLVWREEAGTWRPRRPV